MNLTGLKKRKMAEEFLDRKKKFLQQNSTKPKTLRLVDQKIAGEVGASRKKIYELKREFGLNGEKN